MVFQTLCVCVQVDTTGINFNVSVRQAELRALCGLAPMFRPYRHDGGVVLPLTPQYEKHNLVRRELYCSTSHIYPRRGPFPILGK